MYFQWNRTNLQSQEALQSSKSPIVIRRHVFSVFYTATVAIVHRFSASFTSLRENGDHHKQMADFRFLWKASGVGNCGHLIKVNRFWIVRFSDGLMYDYFVDSIRSIFWMIDTPWIQLVLSCRIRLLQKQIKNQENIHVFALNHWWK